MRTQRCLLELLSFQMGCTYLSDLQFLSPVQLRYLAEKLERIPPWEEDLDEWNDALEYLVHASEEKTSQDARGKLIQLMCQ